MTYKTGVRRGGTGVLQGLTRCGTVQVVSVSVCDGEMGCAITVKKVEEEGPEFERPAPRIEERGGGMTMKKIHRSK